MADLRLVCLHGLGRGPSDWDAARGRLETHGPVTTPTLPRDADAALAAARAAIAPGTVAIDHSLGGIVALRVARAAADIRGVVLTGCPFPVARNGRTRRATALDYAGHRVAFLRSLGDRPPVAGPRRRSPAGLPGIAQVLARPGRFDALASAVAAPVLVVHARDDHHVPVDFALAAVARHPAWQARLLGAGGHHAHVRAPGRWLSAVEPWLRGLEEPVGHEPRATEARHSSSQP
jgi:pimeloyl-ACP methyl ester carboxylesterase